MCLCKGKGGIHFVHSWGIEYIPCPDTNCTYEDNFEERLSRFRERVKQELGDVFENQEENIDKESS